MWLSSQSRRTVSGEPSAEVGDVTIGGSAPGVYLQGERRGMPVFSPGGYHWRPAVGQEVLALKTGAQGENPCVAGARQEDTPEELRPGEILLRGGGASVCLTDGGCIALNGEVKINGAALRDLIEKIVVEVMSSDV